MAEILVRVTDKTNEDFYLDCQCTKRGDVIAAVPDGWPWGVDERNSPHYRIISMPGMSLGDAEALCAPEIDIDPLNPSKTLKRRAFKLDLDALAVTKEIGDFLADDGRAKHILKIVETDKEVMDEKAVIDEAAEFKIDVAKASVTDVLAVKIEKQVTQDPLIIGGAEGVVIG